MFEDGINMARETMSKGWGGPFGAVIVDEKKKIIAVSSNTVLKDNDPTAHAEVNAIREACRIKSTHNLEGCILYTTCYPCPMCMSAAIWANISTIYYSATKEDAQKAGFKDDYIYEYIKNGSNNSSVINVECIKNNECLSLFEEYKRMNGKLY